MYNNITIRIPLEIFISDDIRICLPDNSYFTLNTENLKLNPMIRSIISEAKLNLIQPKINYIQNLLNKSDIKENEN